MAQRLKAAVIGLGVGQSHARAYAALDETELVAVCDMNPARLAAIATELGARAYTEPGQVFADPEIELVSIATPHPSHAALAIAAAQAGKHPIVEKPMTVNLAEADAMIAAARECGVSLGVIFQRRWWPAAQRVRQALDAGAIGRPVLGQCALSWWRTQAYYDRDPWRGRWDTEGGGVLCNQGIHALDMFQWFMGDVVEVFGRWTNLTHPSIEVEDNAAAVLRFASGALGVITATTSARLSHTSIVVHGSTGSSIGVIEEPEGAIGYNHVWTVPGQEGVVAESLAAHVAAGEYIYRADQATNQQEAPHYWPTAYRYARPAEPSYHARQLRDFALAVQTGRQPLVTGEEGRKSLAILLAIYESQRTGLPVALPTR
ncbi:MAG: Gfo/Idh/MocA family oxidoreductase [Chloroflexi bacterium]|nr:Gfo/Idh/MocA family oxidoreductase [Chloroflexota bacterium]